MRWSYRQASNIRHTKSQNLNVENEDVVGAGDTPTTSSEWLKILLPTKLFYTGGLRVIHIFYIKPSI